MKIPNLTAVLLFVFLILIMPGYLTAMGASEDTKAYKSELQQVFDETIDEIYISGTGAVEVKTRFKTLRTRYDIAYTDEAGILDAIIDRAQEQTFTNEEAQFYFRLLQEGKLMKYRQDTYRQRSESYQRELLSLLQRSLESVDSEGSSIDELISILNNYYDFVGLEYDEEYSRLSNLIFSLKEGSITAGEMIKKLKSMKEQLAQKNIQQSGQSSSQQSGQSSSQQQSSKPSEGSSKPESATQKPSNNGSNNRN